MRRILLVCGIVSSLLYAAMNVFVPMLYAGYSSVSQTISELSAIGAPTRPLWVVLAITFALLVAAFGWGVRMSAGPRRALRIAGVLIVVYGLIGVFWPPMHRREVLAAGGGTFTDVLHIAFTFSLFLIMAAIAYGASAFGRRFRIYSVATLVLMFAFGVLTGMQSPGIHTGQPTPWIGVWERASAAAFLQWILVLAVALLFEAQPQLAAVSRPKGLFVPGLQGR